MSGEGVQGININRDARPNINDDLGVDIIPTYLDDQIEDEPSPLDGEEDTPLIEQSGSHAPPAHKLVSSGSKRALDYGHMAKKAVDYGPSWSQNHGKKALYLVNLFLGLYQFGVIAVQFVFIGENLKQIVTSFDKSAQLGTKSYMSIVLIPLILLNFIRHLKFLAYLSVIGNICVIFGFVVIFQYILTPPNIILALDGWFHSFDRLMLYLGSALYAFEGQAMILPMENAMKRKFNMVRPFGVLHTGMALTTIIYAATGFFGCAKFGRAALGSITLNMPSTMLYQLVNLVFVLAIMAGIPLQVYVIVDMFWRGIQRKFLRGPLYRWRVLMLYVFITVTVLIQYAMGMAIPKLELIIPLIGVTVGMIISFVLPPTLEILAFWDEWRDDRTATYRFLMILKDCALILFGMFGMVAGLYANVINIRTHWNE